MKLAKLGLCILAAAVVFTACKNVDFKKTKGGVAYKVFPAGKSKDSIGVGSIVKYNVVRKVVAKGKKDTIIQNSYEGMPQYEDVRASAGTYFDAFSEILTHAHVGDSIYFEQLIDSFIVKQPDLETSTPFRKGDKLISSLRIVQVFKSPEEAQADFTKERTANSDRIEAQELKGFNNSPEVQKQMAIDNKIIEDYLKANNIQTQKSPWGAYVQVIEPGTGPKPVFGKHLQVKYSGTNLDGKEFDAGVFAMQYGAGRSIKGFEEGVRFLGKGGKAKVFVPSILGYGPRGSGDKIQPNQILIFNIELLDIADAPTVQAPPPVQDTSHAGHGH